MTKVSLFASWCAVLLACGGGDDGGGGGDDVVPATVASAEGPCGEICEAEIRCGSTDTQAECTTACATGVDGWMRQDALEIMASCIVGLPCEGDADTCFGEIPVLQAHRDWAPRCQSQLAACDGIDDDICAIDIGTGEEGIIRLFLPTVVDEMTACLDGADCAARLTCIDQVFAKYGVGF